MKWPDAVPFDPMKGEASPVLAALLEDPGSAGPVVLLSVGPLAQRSGWAADTAVAIAAAFAERGESVILADLSLERPELHERLGASNEEGLSDVFLFGASLQHITQTIPGRWFRLIPASPFTPDPSEVLTHARWSGLFEELATNQSKLLVYLPTDVPGAKAFSDRVGHTIVLAEPLELEEVRNVLSEDADVVAHFAGAVVGEGAASNRARDEVAGAGEEPPLPTASTTARRDDAAFEKIRIPKDGARETLIADLRARQRAALMAPPPQMSPLPEAEAAVRPLGARAAGEPGPIFRLRAMYPEAPKPRRSTSLVFVLIVLGGIAGAAWYVYDTRIRAVPIVAPPVDRPQPVQAAPTPVQTVKETPGIALPFSVAIASYQVLSLAQERVAQLLEDEPEISFYIGPIVVQGSLFYRVMAGPVADSVRATALRDTLIAKRIKTITSGWDVLSTPYAFLLGEYTSRAAAEAQREAAAVKGVPSYIIEVTGPDGSTHHKLFAGAYTGPGDAEFMRQILNDAGLPVNLVERSGSIRT